MARLLKALLLTGLLLSAILPLAPALAKPVRRTAQVELAGAGPQATYRHGSALAPAFRAHLKGFKPAGKQQRLVDRHRTGLPARLLPLVVVDAGHGGRDAGAVGPSGTLEKTVTLTVAQELGRQLRATRRYRVVFTRDDDSFVPLHQRVRVAATSKAALMVSVHADASTDRHARGASVYVRPARSVGPDVTRLAGNRANPGAIARALSEAPPIPPGSARLQIALINSMDDDLTMVPDPARQGRFYVLGALGIPSVLVETGFITNRRDEALLRQRRHQTLIANAIREAVDAFFGKPERDGAPRT